jgi:hypothetical protein
LCSHATRLFWIWYEYGSDEVMDMIIMINRDLVIFTSQPTMSTDTVQMQRYPRGAVARGILSLGLHISASLAYYYL